MFWSQITLPGKPRLLMVDASRNVQGWEADFCRRVFDVLRRKQVQLVEGSPFAIDYPGDLDGVLKGAGTFNCLFIFAHGEGAQLAPDARLKGFWEWLSCYDGLSAKLLAVCTAETYDPVTSLAILATKDGFARLAAVPLSPLSPRAAGLFFMKFFTELDLHAHDSITGKMVWFSHSKAKEILKRRHLPGQVGIRC